MSAEQLAADRVRQWFTPDDPSGAELFIRDLFHVDPDPWQVEAVWAIVFDPRHRVSIAACNGPGKTAVAAWSTYYCFIYAYLYAKNHTLVMRATAPTADQLGDVLWTELKRWHAVMPNEVSALFRITADKIEFTGVANSFGTARTAREEKPEALQGVHNEAGFVLFILEEATGIAENVFETVGGGLTAPNAFVLMIMNPTRTSGYAYESHHANRALWRCMTVDHTMSPRVTDEYVESMANEYGRDSNVFRARCLGLWPHEESDQLIPMDWVTAAVARTMSPSGPVVWGVDVARMGSDRSALAKRQGNVLLEPIVTWRELETTQLSELVRDIFDETPVGKRPERICVDDIGVGGGVTDQLRQMGLPVLGVNVSESPAAKKRYVRQRDELWWRCREWLRERSCDLPDDDTLIGELTTVKYRRMDGSDKIKVESKEERKKRLAKGREPGHSPDAADALVLTFAWRPHVATETRPDAPRRRQYVRNLHKMRRRDMSWVA